MLEGLAVFGYLGLFVGSFLASTILPLASEALFSAVVLATDTDAWLCVAVATVGNTLGGLSCYALGYLGKQEWIRRFLRISETRLRLWMNRIRRYGVWMVFFSFLPVIGDLIALSSGYVRCPLLPTATLMLLGKGIRYLFWLYLHGLIFP